MQSGYHTLLLVTHRMHFFILTWQVLGHDTSEQLWMVIAGGVVADDCALVVALL